MNSTTATAQPIYPSWTLRAWPPLLWQLGGKAPFQLQHLGTHITNRGDAQGRSAGQTIWAGHSADGDAGMAWDWVEVCHGVVAMADPMSVITNLRFLGPEGAVLTAFESARHLNELVHALPWQDEVGRALSQ